MEIVLMFKVIFNFKGQKIVVIVRVFVYYWLVLKLGRIGNEKLNLEFGILYLFFIEIEKYISLVFNNWNKLILKLWS